MISHPKFLFIALVLLAGNRGSTQEFNEKFDHWPIDLKINGTVIIANDLSDPSVVSRACRRFSPSTEKPEDKIPAVLFTNQDPEKLKLADDPFLSVFAEDSAKFGLADLDTSQVKSSLKKQGIAVLHLDQKCQFTETQVAKLAEVLHDFLNRQGVVVASRFSAGWLSRYRTSGDLQNLVIQPGLNLVPDTVLETDVQKGIGERRVRATLAAHPRSVGIAISGNTCLVLQGRKMFTFETGEAKFMLAANERLPQRNHLIGAKRTRSNRYDFEYNLVDLTEWRRDAIDRTLPGFPPQNPESPHVEKGTLIIVGGGGMPQGLMESLVNMAGGKDARLVYIPCSEKDSIDGPQRTVEYWKKLGVKSATYLHTKDRIKANSDSEFLEPLKNATGIWFGGGRQWNFADSYYGTQAHKLMKEVLKRGGVIGGSSAGASIQARYLARATPIANYRIMAPGYERGGLGFISGVAIDQHFSQRERQKDMTQLMARHPQLLGIGIDEATAIIVNKSLAEVVGRGKVHFYDRTQPVFPDRPDYIAIAKGETYDLKKRQVVPKSDDLEGTPKQKENGKENSTLPNGK